MDLDGDGVLSMYELQYFYEEQCQKLDNMAIEPLPFEDCLCQMLDLVKPECEGDWFFSILDSISTFISFRQRWENAAILLYLASLFQA